MYPNHSDQSVTKITPEVQCEETEEKIKYLYAFCINQTAMNFNKLAGFNFCWLLCVLLQHAEKLAFGP